MPILPIADLSRFPPLPILPIADLSRFPPSVPLPAVADLSRFPPWDQAAAGFYQSPWETSHPKVQILTVEELLDGRQVDMPPSRDLRTFKKAPKAKKCPDTKEQTLSFGDDQED